VQTSRPRRRAASLVLSSRCRHGADVHRTGWANVCPKFRSGSIRAGGSHHPAHGKIYVIADRKLRSEGRRPFSGPRRCVACGLLFREGSRLSRERASLWFSVSAALDASGRASSASPPPLDDAATSVRRRSRAPTSRALGGTPFAWEPVRRRRRPRPVLAVGIFGRIDAKTLIELGREAAPRDAGRLRHKKHNEVAQA
jgi:hypothetical protein